tara:strand:- start:598 stop:1236 length:639 start_codon:yes stop_codon:yes gene_type:complete
MNKISVLDYGIGNIKSICSALEKSHTKIYLTDDRNEIMSSDGLILPGVGAFAHGMEKLIIKKLDLVIQEFVSTGKPLLGICLGMQMLFDKSMEFGETAGLGLIPGEVLRLKSNNKEPEKLPYVSWCRIKPLSNPWNDTILNGIKSDEHMYFVHSYYAKPTNKDNILSVTEFSGSHYCSTVKKGNIYGCQYHPEKSAEKGLKVINNFVEICKG